MKPLFFFIIFISTLFGAEQKTNQHLQHQIELEKKYAKEQKFYQAKDYDFKAKQVDKKTLDKVPKIEPDYDFDITDVYRDDI